MSSLAVEIGHRIRNYRIGNKQSQEELAEMSGLHPTYIGQVERGEKNATLESISKIAAGLGIALSTLFENIEEAAADEPSCAAKAFGLVQSLPIDKQKRVLEILESIVKL